MDTHTDTIFVEERLEGKAVKNNVTPHLLSDRPFGINIHSMESFRGSIFFVFKFTISS